VEILRSSALVDRIVSVLFDGAGDSYMLKIRVELKNGWLMDCWEHKTPKIGRYSFHVFRDSEMVVRWDNAPHHPEVSTFPYHKHVGEAIQDSEEMGVEQVLAELEAMNG
jgi:hypothetical protein